MKLEVGQLYYSEWCHSDIYINEIIDISDNEVQYKGIKCIKGANPNYESLWTDIEDFLKYSKLLTDDIKVEIL